MKRLKLNRIILLTIILTFVSGIFSPLLYAKKTYPLSVQRYSYQKIVVNQNSLSLSTPIQIYKGWYAFGKGYFPFNAKLASLIDTGFTLADYLDSSKFLEKSSTYVKVKQYLGSIIDLVFLSHKARFKTISNSFKNFKAYCSSERKCFNDVVEFSKGSFFEMTRKVLRDKIAGALTVLKKGLSNQAKAVLDYIVEFSKRPRIVKIAEINNFDHILKRVPEYINSFKKIVSNSKVKCLDKVGAVKVKCLDKVGIVKSAGKKVIKLLNGMGYVADILEVLQRGSQLKQAFDDAAFNKVSNLAVLYSGIKLIIVTGSNLPVIGRICSILDVICSLGEVAYSWWAEKNSLLGIHRAAVKGSEYNQFKKLVMRVWKKQIYPEKKWYYRAGLGSELKFPIKKTIKKTGEDRFEPEIHIDAELYKKIKAESYSRVVGMIDLTCRQHNGSYKDSNGKYHTRFPISKFLYRVLGFYAKNLPDVLNSSQVSERDKEVEKLIIAGFHNKFLLSGNLDYYLKEKDVINLKNSVPWYSFAWGNSAATKLKKFKQDHKEFKDFHFNLIRQGAFRVLSRFDSFRKNDKIARAMRGKDVKGNPISTFMYGYYNHMYEYENLLTHFKKWDMAVVRLANRLRFMFNLCDDIKIHNELIKKGRDDIKNLVNSWDFKTSNRPVKKKKFRNARELGYLFDRITRSCAFQLAFELKKTLSNGSISLVKSVTDKQQKKFEHIAIKNIYSQEDFIKKYLVRHEYDRYNSEDWNQYIPLPIDIEPALSTIHVGFSEELSITYGMFVAMMEAYNYVWLFRNALIRNTRTYVCKELYKPATAKIEQLDKENGDIYIRKLMPELFKYIDLARIAMDGEKEVTLSEKQDKVSYNNKYWKRFWFGNRGLWYHNLVGDKLNWYSKFVPGLFKKISELDGKISDLFVYASCTELRLLEETYKSVMVYHDGTSFTVGDNAFREANNGDLEKKRILKALSKKLKQAESAFVFASDTKTEIYRKPFKALARGMKTGTRISDDKYTTLAPTFLLLEKENGKYKIHMVY